MGAAIALMDLNPQQLRYLLAISRAGSFVKAAEALNVSQPALSIAISRLEDVVNAKLLERGRHGAQLTSAGRHLIRHAESVEMVMASARTEMQLFDQGVAGPFTVGGTPLGTASIIPDAIAQLCQEFPQVNVRVVEDVDEALIDRLLRHELDLVISNLGLTNKPSEIEAIPLFTARAVAVVRPGHEYCERELLTLQDLSSQTCVLPPEGGALRKQIEALFTINSMPFPTNVIEAAPFGVLKEIVRRSDGVTILSDQIVRSELLNGALIAIPLQEQIAVRTFGLQMLKGRKLGNLARRFAEIATRLAPDYSMT
jgi:LysR family pca operon transcriptional activator